MKKYLITVKGISYEVEVEEIKDNEKAREPKKVAPIESKIATAPVSVKSPPESRADSKTISSPMPGSILKVRVKAGDSIKKGDVVIILEAMKMENEILAPDDAVIESVTVSEGSTVSTGDIMVTFK